MNFFRPLSPHLFIYGAQWNSIISILHRFTGIYLTLSLFLLIFIIKFLIFNINFYSIYWLSFHFNTFLAWFVFSFFFIIIFSFFLHLIGGIRHIIWDFGFLLNKKTVDIFAFLTFIGTFFLTFFFFFLI